MYKKKVAVQYSRQTDGEFPLQWCNDVLHHHQVDKENDKNDEEGDIEESVLDQSSKDLLPNAEVAGQHIWLSQREYNPTWWKDVIMQFH